MILLLLIPVVYLIYFIISNKIIIRIDTIFRKGFEKKNDVYRSILLHWEAGRPVRLIALLTFFLHLIFLNVFSLPMFYLFIKIFLQALLFMNPILTGFMNSLKICLIVLNMLSFMMKFLL